MEKEIFTLGNTLTQSYVATVLDKHQSNVSRMVSEGKLRKVDVHGEKFPRIPLWDVLRFLQQEHVELTDRKKKVEQYFNHLGNIYVLYQDLHSETQQPSRRVQDIQNMVEELINGGKQEYGN